MDNRLKNHYKKIYLFLLIILLIIISVVIYHKNLSTIIKSLKNSTDNLLTFNYESGFYNHDLNIKIHTDIEIPFNSKIYYTLNGNDPKETDNLYEENIKIEIDETQTKVIPLKARIFYNGEYSKVYQQTYIIDKDIYNRFNMNVISITSDSYNLYDYYYGILVGGYNYDLDKKNNPNKQDYHILGNYRLRTDEWLRDAHVAMFTKDGMSIINDNFLIGISGGTTAIQDVKSFKIKSINDEKINFMYNDESSKFSIVDEYNSLRFRCGAHDRLESNIRSSVFSKLALESNFDGYSNTERAVLFLNGKFYGIYDIQQNYSNSFLGKRFNIENTDNIVKLKGNLDSNLKEAGVYQYIDTDLNYEENRKKLEKLLDIDNYLLYMAIELISNNQDWYTNNTEIWYYDTTKGKEDSKYADGKIRTLLYDVDMTYYNEYTFPWNTAYDVYVNKFTNLLNNSTSFSLLMDSKYYRDKFITIVCDLINTSFESQNIIKIIDEEFAKIEKESKLQFNKNTYNKMIINISEMKETVITRNQEIISDIELKWNLKEKYKFNIKCNSGIKVYWNNMEIFERDTYSNEYYSDVNFIISYEEYPGYKFDYWLVNGQKIYDTKLEIKKELIEDNQINIEVIAKRDNSQSLVICEIDAKDDLDWIKLINIGTSDVNLADYYISDEYKNLKKERLPNITLKSNESIILSQDEFHFATGDYILNFSLRKGEAIYLYNNIEQKITDKIIVPRMSNSETYGRYLNSNTFMYFNNTDNKRRVSTY